MSETYNLQEPVREFTKPIEATVIKTPTTCRLRLRMAGGLTERERMPGLGQRAILVYGKKSREVWVSETFGDVGYLHEEHRSVCTGVRLKIEATTNVTLEPIPKATLIERANELLRKKITNKGDAWTLRTIFFSLLPYKDDPDVLDLCRRAKPVIESYVVSNRPPHRPSLHDIELLFERI